MPCVSVLKRPSTTNEPALVDLDLDRAEAKPVGVGPAPDRQQHPVTGDGVLALDGYRRALLGRLGAGHAGTQHELETLLLERLQRLAGELGVHAGEDPVEVFQHRHPGAEPAPYRAQLEANVAGADHHQVLGHLRIRERFGAGADAVAIGLDPRQSGHRRAGGDHDVLGLELLVTVGAVYRDLAGGGDLAATQVAGDLVLLQQEGDAVGVGFHYPFLALEHDREIQADPFDVHAVLGEVVVGVEVALARLEQRLAGDAADAHAGATESVFSLHTGDIEAELRRADGSDVASGAGADDDQVVFGHRQGLQRSQSTAGGREPGIGRWRFGRSTRGSGELHTTAAIKTR